MLLAFTNFLTSASPIHIPRYACKPPEMIDCMNMVRVVPGEFSPVYPRTAEVAECRTDTAADALGWIAD